MRENWKPQIQEFYFRSLGSIGEEKPETQSDGADMTVAN